LGGGAGGAPNNAAYLLASLDGTLTNDRALTGGSNISLTDGGAGGSFTVATVQNPTFTTSVTTPLLQSSGALTISSAAGNTVAIDAGTTIELQDSTNVTGSLDVSATFTSGTANAFQVSAAGAVTTATGITSSGTITFSGLNCTSFANGGALTTNASGQLACSDDDGGAGGAISGSGTNGTIPVFTGSNTIANSIVTQSGTTISIAGDLTLNTALSVANGGTGATSFTTRGVLYGNGSGAVQVTAAGTGGQVLIANASGVPTFATFSGDVVVSNTGVTTIQADSVALGADTTGNYVANLGSLTGLTTTGNTGEGSTPTLGVSYGSGANTAVQGNTSLTCASGSGNLSGGGNSVTLGAGGSCNNISIVNNPTFTTSVTTPSLILTGAGSNGTVQVANLGQTTTYTLPDPGGAAASFCLSTGNCSATGTAGGDLTGSFPNPTIAKLQSGTLTITSVASGNILQYNGSAWVNQNVTGDVTLNSSAVATIQPSSVDSGKIANGTIANVDLATGSFSNITGVGTLTALTVTGATSINTTGTANTAIGNATGTFQVASSALNISTAGALSGVASIATSGGYTQTGSGANTFSGASSFTAAGTALSVTNDATIGGTMTVNTITPNSALSVGVTGQSFTVQGNAMSTIKATDTGHTTTLAFATPTADTTISIPALPAGPYTLCTSSGNCGGVGATLQTAYTNSTNPEIVLDATRGALTIRDTSGGLAANLFEVQNNGGSTTYFNVTATGTNTTGSNVASGTINTTGGALQTASTDRITNGGNLVNIGTISTSGAINSQTISSAANFTGTLTIQGSNALTLGTASTNTGAIVFKGSGGAGTLTLSGPTTPNVGNFTLSLPAIGANATVCTDNSICSGYAPSTGSTSYATRALDNLASVAINTALGFQSNQAANINFAGAAAAAGNTLTITGQTAGATANNGGDLTLQGGLATTTGQGGTTTVRGGNTTATGTNGTLTLDAGSGATTANGTINLGNNNASAINIGANNTLTSTIQIGATAQSANTQTINIGNSNTAGGTTNVTIGSGPSAAGGTTTVRAKGALTLSGGAASTLNVGANTLAVTSSNFNVTAGGAVSAVSDTLSGANALTLGTASTNTGAIVFKGSGGAGTLTLSGPTTPNAGNFTLTLPAIAANANVCTDNTVCTGYQAAGNYLVQAPTSTLTNTITPTTTNVVGLTVNATSGATSQVAAVFNQGNATSPADTVQINTTSTGAQTNGLLFNRNAGGGTTTNGINITNTAGTLTNGLAFTGTIGTDIQRSSGTLTIQGAGGVSVTTPNVAGASSSITLQSGNSSAGTAGNVSIDTGTTSTGTPTVNIGATNAKSVQIGNSTSNPSVSIDSGTGSINIGAGAQSRSINVGTGAANQTITIGNSTGTSRVNIISGPSSAVYVGANITDTFGSTVNIASTADGTGTQFVTIGSTANGSNVLNLRAGTSGGVNIGSVGSATTGSTIHIADTTNATSIQAVTIGSNANAANTTAIQGGNGATAITLTPQTTGQVVIGAAAGTGQITLGSSSAAQTVAIAAGTGAATVNIANASTAGSTVSVLGAATATGNTDTLNLATGNTAGTGSKVVHIADGTPAGTGTNTVTIGSLTNASTTTIQAGTGNIKLTTNQAGAGTVVKTATNNSTTAFQIQDAASTSFFTADSVNKFITTTDMNVGATSGKRLFSDSFEGNSFGLWDQGSTITGTSTVTIDSTIKRSGSYSAKLTMGSGNAYYLTRMKSTTGNLYMRGYAYVSARAGTGFVNLFGVNPNSVLADGFDAEVKISDGHLYLYDGSLHTDRDTGVVVSLNAWHKVEIRTTTVSGGALQIYLDGTVVGNFTTSATSAAFNQLVIGDDNNGNPTGSTVYIDDISVDPSPTGTTDGGSLTVQDSFHVSGTSTLGQTVITPGTDTTGVFQVQNAAGAQIFRVDTNTPAAYLGTSTTGVSTLFMSTVSGTDSGIFLQSGSVLGSSNIQYALSKRANNTDLWLYGYDGTNFRNYLQTDWAGNSMSLNASGGTTNIGSTGSVTTSSTTHIGDTTNATGTQTVVIGSSANTASSTTMQGGTLTMSTSSSTAGSLFRTTTNSSAALQVQNSSNDVLFNMTTVAKTDLITNPGFETNTTAPWATVNGGTITLSRVTTAPYAGVGSMQVAITTATQWAGAKYATSLTNGQSYTLSFYVKSSSGTALIDAGYSNTGAFAGEQDCVSTFPAIYTTGWTRFSCTFTAGAPSGSPYIYIETPSAATATFWIDNVQLTQTTTDNGAYYSGLIDFGASTVSGQVAFQATNDATSAFQVFSSTGMPIFQIDTINKQAMATRLVLTDNFTDPTKAWRFRTDGSGLDFETSGGIGPGSMWITGWSGTGGGFSGTQYTFMRTDPTLNQPIVTLGAGFGSSTPTLTVLDTKNTSGDPSYGTNGAMYYNGNTNTFRCYQNGAWANCIGVTTSDSFRQQPFYSTDFMNDPSSTGGTSTSLMLAPWYGSLIATAGSAINTAGVANHPGMVRLQSGAPVNSGWYFETNASSVLISGGESFELTFRTPAAFTSITSRLGFLDTITSTDATDGVYCEISGSGVISGKTASNSTRSTTGTTLTLSTSTFYRAKIQVNSAASSITYTVYNDSGTSLWTDTLSANIPTAAGRETGTGVVSTNAGGTGAPLIDLDYMALWLSKSLTR
jgi:fibronectin-binding autotransporter adhesin